MEEKDNQEIIVKKKEIKNDNPFITSGKKKLCRFLFIMTIILGNLTFLYLFIPIFSFFAWIILGCIYIIIVGIPVIFTLGGVLLNEDFAKFAGDFGSIIGNIFNDGAAVLSFLNPYFLPVAYTSLGFALASLVIGSIFRGKAKQGFILPIIFGAIYFSFNVLFLVLYYYNGQALLGLSK